MDFDQIIISLFAAVMAIMFAIQAYDHFLAHSVKKEIDTQPIVVKKNIHKKHDKTVFSQEDYDRIMEMYEKHMLFNMNHKYKERRSLKDLTKVLNETLGLDKSVTAYSTIWNGKVQKDSLPLERK